MDEDPSTGLGSNPGLPLTSSEMLGGFLFLLASASCKMGTRTESPQGALVGLGCVASEGLLLRPCTGSASSPFSRTLGREEGSVPFYRCVN